MKKIKLFEEFNNIKYQWPDFKLWINELHPEEICFLLIYNSILEYRFNENPNLNNLSERIFFRVESTKGSYELEPLDYNEDKGESTFEMYFRIPLMDPFSKDSGFVTLSFDCEAKGKFNPYISGGYMDPPEGGEPVLENIELNSDIQYEDTLNDTVIDFSNSSYDFKSDLITKKDLINIMKYSAAERIEAEDDTETYAPIIPDGLLSKCEEIRESDKYRKLTLAINIVNRFK